MLSPLGVGQVYKHLLRNRNSPNNWNVVAGKSRSSSVLVRTGNQQSLVVSSVHPMSNVFKKTDEYERRTPFSATTFQISVLRFGSRSTLSISSATSCCWTGFRATSNSKVAWSMVQVSLRIKLMPNSSLQLPKNAKTSDGMLFIFRGKIEWATCHPFRMTG